MVWVKSGYAILLGHGTLKYVASQDWIEVRIVSKTSFAVSIIIYALIRFYVIPSDKYGHFESDPSLFGCNQLKTHNSFNDIWFCSLSPKLLVNAPRLSLTSSKIPSAVNYEFVYHSSANTRRHCYKNIECIIQGWVNYFILISVITSENVSANAEVNFLCCIS